MGTVAQVFTMAATEMGAYYGPKPLAIEEPWTRFHSNTKIPDEFMAPGEVLMVRPSKAAGACNPLFRGLDHVPTAQERMQGIKGKEPKPASGRTFHSPFP